METTKSIIWASQMHRLVLLKAQIEALSKASIEKFKSARHCITFTLYTETTLNVGDPTIATTPDT